MKDRIKAFRIIKPNKEKRIVCLFEHKEDGTYSFVNLTTGKITPCRFKTIEEAIADLQKYVNEGKIYNFIEIEHLWIEYVCNPDKEYKGEIDE